MEKIRREPKHCAPWVCCFLSTEGLLSHPQAHSQASEVLGLPRMIQAGQLYLQTQEMSVEEGIPVLGLDPALLGSDPCHAIPRGVSDGTAAGSELGRIFFLAIRVPLLLFPPVKEIPQSRDLECEQERSVTTIYPSSACQPQGPSLDILPVHHHCPQTEGGITC